jgi:hypothetical protein
MIVNDISPDPVGPVLVEPVLIEGNRHILSAWSDDNRVTWADCACPLGGRWKHHGLNAQTVVDAWSKHTRGEA